MEKVKLEFGTPENKIIEYNDTKIELVPFLDFEKQIVLIKNYIEDYFGNLQEVLVENTKYHYLEAECRLMNYIIQLNTNIDIESSLNWIYAESQLWDKITSEIVNWWQFRDRLDSIVSDVKREEDLKNSIGTIVGGLLQNLNETLDKFSEITPDDVNNMQKGVMETIEKLEKSTVLNNPADIAAIESTSSEGA